MIINSPEKILPSPYQIVQLKITPIIIILWEFFLSFTYQILQPQITPKSK